MAIPNRNPAPESVDFDAAFDRSFALASFAMNRFIVDHMLRVGRHLTHDDYESMVIWGVLAHQNIAHLLPPGSVPSEILNERGRLGYDKAMRPLRLRDVVQITRIPRETVRRKLEQLAQDGWVERVGDGWLVRRDRAEPDLREFARESMRRFLAAAEEAQRAIRAGAEAVAADRAAQPVATQPLAAQA